MPELPNVLTIKTDAPVEFMGEIAKRVNRAIEAGYKDGEGSLQRFMSDKPYSYTFEYENNDF